jgi:hypothetical protein
MSKKILLVATAMLCLLNACKSYVIPVDSFKSQFRDIDSSKMSEVTATTGMISFKYKANPLGIIECKDKKTGEVTSLHNGPSIESRITYKDHNKVKRTIFYFDTMYMPDTTTVAGSESRFVPDITKTIPVDSITLIEVQDGHKHFKYVK